jgi:glutamyl-tRNA reductase
MPHCSRSVSSCACQVVPTIAALRSYATEIRDAEVTRALARLGNVSAGDAVVVRALAQRIVDRLLHRPAMLLEGDSEGANMAHVIRQLFQLQPEAEWPGCRQFALGRVEVDPAA